MKKLLQHAANLRKEISKQYNLLTIDKNEFFDTYHDIMRCQMECAYASFNELEGCNDKRIVESTIKDLEKTVHYCRSVIALQAQTNLLPEPIYG